MFILDPRFRKDDGRRGVAGGGFSPLMSPSKLGPRVQDKESLFGGAVTPLILKKRN